MKPKYIGIFIACNRRYTTIKHYGQIFLVVFERVNHTWRKKVAEVKKPTASNTPSPVHSLANWSTWHKTDGLVVRCIILQTNNIACICYWWSFNLPPLLSSGEGSILMHNNVRVVRYLHHGYFLCLERGGSNTSWINDFWGYLWIGYIGK